MTAKTIFGNIPTIMGVVNVTPDSFSDGGSYAQVDAAIAHGERLAVEGAHILDIGGESTRPGAAEVSPDIETERVVPVIEGLRGRCPWISVDTRHASTMEAALRAGANSINDISALRHDPKAIHIIKEAQVPVFLMHMQGVPQSMQKNPIYNNVIEDVFHFFEERISTCERHRIDPNLLVIDPGIGFGKTLEHNLLLLKHISHFHNLNRPVLLGTSRKSFIGKIANQGDAQKRLPGSLASTLWGLSQGVQIFRVHDVAETVQAFQVYQAILEADEGSEARNSSNAAS